jgi:hypothetical protein
MKPNSIDILAVPKNVATSPLVSDTVESQNTPKGALREIIVKRGREIQEPKEDKNTAEVNHAQANALFHVDRLSRKIGATDIGNANRHQRPLPNPRRKSLVGNIGRQMHTVPADQKSQHGSRRQRIRQPGARSSAAKNLP